MKSQTFEAFITYDRKAYSRISIPIDISEVSLKSYLQRNGFISEDIFEAYLTNVFVDHESDLEYSNCMEDLTEICNGKWRRLKEMGIDPQDDKVCILYIQDPQYA